MTDSIVIQQQALMYPPRIDLGSLRTVETPRDIPNKILMFCETIQGERPLLPSWGLPQIVHVPQTSAADVAALVNINLTKWFTGINFVVTIREEPYLGALDLNVEYSSPEGYGTVIVSF